MNSNINNNLANTNSNINNNQMHINDNLNPKTERDKKVNIMKNQFDNVNYNFLVQLMRFFIAFKSPFLISFFNLIN